jgi:menaquinone-dependent protoporphyrinogen IX oxidase
MAKKTLVAYISAGGATEHYANIIAETLRARGHEVDLANLKRDRLADLSAYSTIVAGMGVRMGMVYRKGKRFLARPDVAGKRLAIYLSSGIAIEKPDEAKRKFLTPVVEKLGLAPVLYDAFPGIPPGQGAKLQEATDSETARAWAERLADGEQ